MTVSEILRKVKPINKNLHAALKRALTHPYDSYYNHNYAQFTSLAHAIDSGFKWKNTEEGYEYWEGILSGIASAKDGSNSYYDELSFISEAHRKRYSRKFTGQYVTPRMLINEAISVNYSIGIRIQYEYMRYNPGTIDVHYRHLSLYSIIGSIYWEKTKEGYLWWENLRNTIFDDNWNLIPEKLKDYDSATK